jgi:hypothetical protein
MQREIEIAWIIAAEGMKMGHPNGFKSICISFKQSAIEPGHTSIHVCHLCNLISIAYQ